MDSVSLRRNFSTAMVAQMVTMLVSIATVILMPKVMDGDDYGYWQLFIFYSGYVGLATLGITDGTYLLMGGKTREELPRDRVVSQLLFCLLYQVLLAVLAVPLLAMASDAPRQLVIVATGLFLIMYNASAYLGYIFQAINETSTFSQSIILKKGIVLCGFVPFIILGIGSFLPYILVYLGSELAALVYVVVRARWLLAAPLMSIRETASSVVSSMRVGMKLMVAVNAGTLVIGFARLVIDATWPIEVFGQVSFSLSIVNFIMAFVGQVSMVLFPALRRCSTDELAETYRKGEALLSVILPLALLLYWPACILVRLWLPDYTASLHYMAILAPLCLFDGRMNVLVTTYCKVLREESSLLVLNVAALVLSVVLCGAVAWLGGSVEAVLLAAVVAVAARSLVGELLVTKRLGLRQGASGGSLMLAAVFIGACDLLDPLPALAVFLVALVVHAVCARDKIVRMTRRILHR